MLKAKSKSILVLSSIIAILTAIAAGGGLLFPNVYQDGAISNGFNKAGWQGNDIVTLIIEVPIFIGALIFAQRGSLRAWLVWLGMLYFTLYNYAFYLFGAAINWFFLLYLALFTLPMLVLIFALVNTDTSNLGQKFRLTVSARRWVSGYMLFFASFMLLVWIAQWVSFVATGSLDSGMGNFIRTVAGVDIAFLASSLVTGAVWLQKQRPWGYVLATILNVSNTIYMLVLTVGYLNQAMAGVEGATATIPLWIFLGIACLAASLVLLGNVQSESWQHQ